MLFSKSFGYALRGVLFIAATQEEKRFVPADEIAGALGVPKFFLAKILKSLVKNGFLISVKGPHGGFEVPSAVCDRSLLDLFAATDGLELFQSCVLRLKACNPDNPCPLHCHFKDIQQSVHAVMNAHSIGSFLGGSRETLLRSLSADGPELFSETIFLKN